KSTRLNSSHVEISYAVFCLKKDQTCALRSEEHTSELQSRRDLVWRLLLEKKNFSFVHYNIQLSMHEATMPPSKRQGTMDGFVVGIIGMGDMGKMYAFFYSEAGRRYLPFFPPSRYSD